jgi:hypothetical protein
MLDIPEKSRANSETQQAPSTEEMRERVKEAYRILLRGLERKYGRIETCDDKQAMVSYSKT